MDAVRIAVGCSVLALVAAGGLSQMSHRSLGGLAASARGIIGAGTAAEPAPGAAVAPLAARPEPVPAPLAPVTDTGFEDEVIPADARGQFQTSIEIDGERLPALVDTGATLVALSYEDADRLGIRPLPADFRLPMSTANGRTFAAPVRLRSIRLGRIELHDVQAIVVGRGQLNGTLLGMSFLSRLSGVSVRNGRLMLRP